MARLSYPQRLTVSDAERLAREVARDSQRLFVTDHAEDRMLERGFSMRDLLSILERGHVEGQPALTRYGEWKFKMTLRMENRREAGAVNVLSKAGELVVVTMEWEDLH